MNELQKKFEGWKVEREVDKYNESYGFREGYVKAMCDAINAVKKHLEINKHDIIIDKRKACRCYEIPPKYYKDKCDTCGKDYI